MGRSKLLARGWAQRNLALGWIREHFKNATRNCVVYFADDDNTYDIRLFDNYVRKVKRLGVWAVALAGAAYVEAPRVQNNKVVGWDVVYAPKRAFAVDMAGFAVNLKEILRSSVIFEKVCKQKAPETCFLWRMGFRIGDAEPFGHDANPKEVLVWHTKTRKLTVKGGNHGYLIEMLVEKTNTTKAPEKVNNPPLVQRKESQKPKSVTQAPAPRPSKKS